MIEMHTCTNLPASTIPEMNLDALHKFAKLNPMYDNSRIRYCKSELHRIRGRYELVYSIKHDTSYAPFYPTITPLHLSKAALGVKPIDIGSGDGR